MEELIRGTDLSQAQTEELMEELLKDPNPSVIAAFLVLLRVKGETINEVYDLLQCACDWSEEFVLDLLFSTSRVLLVDLLKIFFSTICGSLSGVECSGQKVMNLEYWGE